MCLLYVRARDGGQLVKRLSVAMVTLGKALLKDENWEKERVSFSPLGDSYSLAPILLHDSHSSHFTHVLDFVVSSLSFPPIIHY